MQRISSVSFFQVRDSILQSPLVYEVYNDLSEIIANGCTLGFVHVCGGSLINSGTPLENFIWGFSFGTLAKCSFLIQDRLPLIESLQWIDARSLVSACIIARISTVITNIFFNDNNIEKYHAGLLFSYFCCLHIMKNVQVYFNSIKRLSTNCFSEEKFSFFLLKKPGDRSKLE